MPLSNAAVDRLWRNGRQVQTWPTRTPPTGVIHRVLWGQLNRTLCPKALNYHQLENTLGANQLTSQWNRVTCATCKEIYRIMTERGPGGSMTAEEALMVWEELGEGEAHDLEPD